MIPRFSLFCVLLLLLSIPFAAADIGIGLSPAKRVFHNIEGGQTIEETYTVYNTGDGPINANLGADGAIASFVTVIPKAVYVEPEPQPHSLPIKNGKQFTVRYKVPTGWEAKLYTGQIVASGGAAGGTLGGNVAVAMVVELYSIPTKYFWNRISKEQYLLTGSIFLFLMLLLLTLVYMRRKGIQIQLVKSRRP
ncbi:hypothetical protein HZB00_02415 [Candidatus Woesearchaeota archaeon]|nr:hypothetical protein [Candidatus Woesearchaeota archaeon]